MASAGASSDTSRWSLSHPENWGPDAVQEWICFVGNKYGFTQQVLISVRRMLSGTSGAKLLEMSLPDFRREFRNYGELIYTTFQQILDVAPNYEDRANIYSSKIFALLQTLEGTTGEENHKPKWPQLDPENWSCVEVYDWLENCTQQYHRETRDRKLLFEKCRSLSGLDLCAMSVDDFKRLSQTYGEFLYTSLKQIKEKGDTRRKRHRSSGELPTVLEEKNDN